MAERWSDLPRALPPEVVEAIWKEIDAIHPRVRTMDGMLREFVRRAIDPPHYAKVSEVAAALRESTSRVNFVRYEVIGAARASRLTGGTKAGTYSK
jgi:hypothetical protein